MLVSCMYLELEAQRPSVIYFFVCWEVFQRVCCKFESRNAIFYTAVVPVTVIFMLGGHSHAGFIVTHQLTAGNLQAEGTRPSLGNVGHCLSIPRRPQTRRSNQ